MWQLVALVTICDAVWLNQQLEEHQESVSLVLHRAHVLLPPHCWGGGEAAHGHVIHLLQVGERAGV